MKTLAELFAEDEAKPAPAEDPQMVARNRAKAEAERARHIALGWYDEHGNPGPNAEPDEPGEEDEE